eukprot:TRINITY_DN66300_c3_g2_i1.p1 TRINITY_DN66300_c3_g2~~TRINITY_DN66300_c3_g2_i1.p1  ORF type:complete len:1299 (-),score=600.37 TRINITY_DN66300_c3_g2_i1:79-3408(-)
MQTVYVLMDWADATSVCTKSALESLLFTGTKNMAGWFSDMSNGKLLMGTTEPGGTRSAMDYRVFGPYTFNSFSKADDCYAKYNSWLSEAKAKLKSLGAGVYKETDFGNIIVVTPKPTSCKFAGRASLSGSCWPRSNAGPACGGAMLRCAMWVFTHELGHNLNMHHAAQDLDDDDDVASDQTYKDWSCVMGNRAVWNRLNSYHMYQKGFLKTDRVKLIDEPGDYDLTSLDISTNSAEHPQIIQFVDKSTYPSKEYFLSLRTPLTYASDLSATYKNNINVHYKRSDSSYSHFVKNLGSSSHTSTHLKWVMSQTSVDLAKGNAKLRIAPCASGTGCPYSWNSGAWGACSKVCNTGTQTRTVTCRKDDGTTVKDGYCMFDGDKPITSRECNTHSCDYDWVVGEYSTTCSKVCGGGVFTRSVECHNKQDAVVDDSFCTNTKPDTTKPCNTQACPEYDWHTTEWSQCSKSCDGGTQSRTVTCKEIVNGQPTDTVAESNCAETKPAATRACNTQPCDPCKARHCGGDEAGRCVRVGETGSRCDCINAYGGENCTVAPRLLGVTFEEEVDVTNGFDVFWTSEGNITAVSVLVQRDGVPFGSVVTSSTDNDGEYSFEGTAFDVSGNYSVIVAATDKVRNTSKLFYVNACDHRACGNNGQCNQNTDGRCTCSNGYTGELCDTPPPDPCAGIVCQNSGTCNNQTGECDCPANSTYSGVYCERDTQTCRVACENFGRVDAECKGCNCSAAPDHANKPWGGPECTECTRDCAGRGKPSSDCAKCDCSLGFVGADSQCDRRVLSVTLGPLSTSYSDVLANRDLFESSFEADVANALGIDKSRVDVVGIKSGVYVSFYLVSLPLDKYNVSVGASASFVTSLSVTNAEQRIEAALEELRELVDSLKQMATQSTSKLYRGAVTSLMSPQSSTISVSDPATPPPPPTGSGNGVNVAAVVLGVTFAFLAIAIAAIVYYRYRRDGYVDCDWITDRLPSKTTMGSGTAEGEGMRPTAFKFKSTYTNNIRMDNVQPYRSQPSYQPSAMASATNFMNNEPVAVNTAAGYGYNTTTTAAAATTNDGQPGAPPALPPRSTAPVQWDTYYTDDGVPYYYNRITQETVWELPENAM